MSKLHVDPDATVSKVDVDMKPALSWDEWERGMGDVLNGYASEDLGVIDIRADLGHHSLQGGIHKLAAFCLEGQPFGFTREDVEMLREEAGTIALDSGMDRDAWAIAAKNLTNLADRIEALLPPEDV